MRVQFNISSDSVRVMYNNKTYVYSLIHIFIQLQFVSKSNWKNKAFEMTDTVLLYGIYFLEM